MFKVNNKNFRTTSLMSFWCFSVNFKDILHLFLVNLLFNVNKYMLGGLLQSADLCENF